MAKSSLRSRRKQNNPQLDLWEFVNRLNIHSKKNTFTRPPDSKSTQAQQNGFINRVTMLEIAQVEHPCVFKTSTHLVSMLTKFDQEKGRRYTNDCLIVRTKNVS